MRGDKEKQNAMRRHIYPLRFIVVHLCDLLCSYFIIEACKTHTDSERECIQVCTCVCLCVRCVHTGQQHVTASHMTVWNS